MDARGGADASSMGNDWLFTDARLGMALSDPEGRWVDVNPALCELLGYGASELVGRRPQEFTHPDDREQTTRAFAALAGGTRPGLDIEKRYITRDGTVIWALVSVSVTRDPRTGDVIHFAQMQDITARKHAELALAESDGRWRTLLAHLQEIVVLADRSGRLAYATPSIERWLGYRPEELVGAELSATAHPEDRDELMEAFRSVVPGKPMVITHRTRHRDASWHTLESTFICLRDDPTVQAVLIASTDITDQHALAGERERHDLERRMSHRLEAVGQLAAGIAHEINTPLQYVGDSLTFLEEAVDELLILVGRYRQMLWSDSPLALDDRQRIMTEAEEHADVDYLCERIPAAFTRTTDGVSRVRSIVQAMKRFSHASSVEVAPADLNEALATTLAVCRNEYKYVAEVELRLDAELPLVPCNVGEINQVFLNLIVNAAQAIEAVREPDAPLGRIAISTGLADGQAVIEIADDGPGIAPAVLERIYEPFFTTKEVGKGTGQGLALSRATVERHSGSLECQSVAGAGATFTVRLPLEAVASAPVPATAPDPAVTQGV